MTPSARAENPFVACLVAAVVGALVLWASDLVMPPSPVAFEGHGQSFQAMTLAPWSLTGAFPHRVLWPLLAHLTWLDGARAPVFAQVTNAALLAVVFWCCRARGARWLDALLVTCGVATTGAVLVYKPMACLSDPLNFLLLLLAMHFVARPRVFWALVLASAFSHELSFFLAPWLLYLRCGAGGTWRREVVALAIVVAIYAAWLAVVGAVGQGASYGIRYYLEHNFWVPWGLPALWALWSLSMLVEFGPLLVVIGWAWRRRRLGTEQPGLGGSAPWLLLGCMLPMMLLAYDVMRFAGLLVLLLVPASMALLRQPRGRAWFAVLLVAAIVTYGLTHPNPTEGGGRSYVHVGSIAHDLLRQDLERGVAPMGTFADAMHYCGQLFARTYDVWLAALAGWVAVVFASLWSSRYVGPAGSVPRTTQNASP